MAGAGQARADGTGPNLPQVRTGDGSAGPNLAQLPTGHRLSPTGYTGL